MVSDGKVKSKGEKESETRKKNIRKMAAAQRACKPRLVRGRTQDVLYGVGDPCGATRRGVSNWLVAWQQGWAAMGWRRSM